MARVYGRGSAGAPPRRRAARPPPCARSHGGLAPGWHRAVGPSGPPDRLDGPVGSAAPEACTLAMSGSCREHPRAWLRRLHSMLAWHALSQRAALVASTREAALFACARKVALFACTRKGVLSHTLEKMALFACTRQRGSFRMHSSKWLFSHTLVEVDLFAYTRKSGSVRIHSQKRLFSHALVKATGVRHTGPSPPPPRWTVGNPRGDSDG